MPDGDPIVGDVKMYKIISFPPDLVGRSVGSLRPKHYNFAINATCQIIIQSYVIALCQNILLKLPCGQQLLVVKHTNAILLLS